MIRRALVIVATMVCALCAQAGVPARAETSQTVAGARVVAVAASVVRTLVDGPDRSIAPAFAVADQHVANGSVSIVAAGTPFVSATYITVPVDIDVDGKPARRVVAGFRVTTYVRTAVAARDLAPGSVLAEGDLTLARMPSNGRPAVGTEVLLGRKLSAASAKGAPLYVEQTVPDTIVRAGQPAILIVHDGPVALAADVEARTAGALGDTVTVYNPQTRKALAGIVTGPNRVEITLAGVTQ